MAAGDRVVAACRKEQDALDLRAGQEPRNPRSEMTALFRVLTLTTATAAQPAGSPPN
jgi:hypothetical protein